MLRDRCLRLVGIYEIRCKPRVIRQFSLLCCQLLSLLLLRGDRRLACLLAVDVWLGARLTRNAWNGLAGRTVSCGGRLLSRSCCGKRWVAGSSGLLSLPLLLRGKLVLEVLDVIVCVVLHSGLRRFVSRRCLLRGRVLARAAKYGSQDNEQRRPKIDERLQILRKTPLGSCTSLTSSGSGGTACCALIVVSVIVRPVSIECGYPLRENSMRFLPSST